MERQTKLNQSISELIAFFELDQVGFESMIMDKDVYLKLISYFEGEQEYDHAIDITDTAIRYYKYHTEFLIIRAKILLYKKDFINALNYIEKAEKIDPRVLEIRLLKIQILSLLGEFDIAISIANELASIVTKEELSLVYLTESYIYENMSDYETMYNVLYKAAVLDPLNEDILVRLWNTIQTSRYYYKGIKLYSRLIDIQPFSYLAWYHLGNAYIYVGEYSKAIDAMEYSFLIKNDFEEGYLEFAELCIQEKQYKKALDSYIDVLELIGEDPELLTNIGNCFYLLDNNSTARKYFKQALALDSFNDQIYGLMAKNYLAMNSPKLAIEALTKAIDIDDEVEEYYYFMAKAFRMNGEISNALKYYRKATRICPEQSFFWKKYVDYLVELKLYTKAVEIIQKAYYYTYDVELDYYFATIQIQLGKKKEGIQKLEEALKEDFDKHNVIFKLIGNLKEDKDVNALIDYYYRELNPIFK